MVKRPILREQARAVDDLDLVSVARKDLQAPRLGLDAVDLDNHRRAMRGKDYGCATQYVDFRPFDVDLEEVRGEVRARGTVDRDAIRHGVLRPDEGSHGPYGMGVSVKDPLHLGR